MDRRDMTDRRIGREAAMQFSGIVGFVLANLIDRMGPADSSANLDHPRAVGAVDQHQNLAGGRHQRAQRRLDRESAAALDRHADMGLPGIGDGQQAPAYVGIAAFTLAEMVSGPGVSRMGSMGLSLMVWARAGFSGR